MHLGGTDIPVQGSFDDGADFLGPRRADLPTLRARLLRQQIFSSNLTEGMVEHRDIMLQPEPDVRVLVEGAFPRHINVCCLEGNGLVAVCLRNLHPAVPHAMLHVATPEDH
jgi:hypothetical protein